MAAWAAGASPLLEVALVGHTVITAVRGVPQQDGLVWCLPDLAGVAHIEDSTVVMRERAAPSRAETKEHHLLVIIS